MKALSITTEIATIAISNDEMAFLSNAINETLEALRDWEFRTRTGMSRSQAMNIGTELRAILDKMPKA